MGGHWFLQSLKDLRTGQRWSKAIWTLAVTSPRCVQVESQKGWGHVLRRLSWSSPSNALEQPLRWASWFLLDLFFRFCGSERGHWMLSGCTVCHNFFNAFLRVDGMKARNRSGNFAHRVAFFTCSGKEPTGLCSMEQVGLSSVPWPSSRGKICSE